MPQHSCVYVYRRDNRTTASTIAATAANATAAAASTAGPTPTPTPPPPPPARAATTTTTITTTTTTTTTGYCYCCYYYYYYTATPRRPLQEHSNQSSSEDERMMPSTGMPNSVSRTQQSISSTAKWVLPSSRKATRSARDEHPRAEHPLPNWLVDPDFLDIALQCVLLPEQGHDFLSAWGVLVCSLK